jgi:hypothetical protein
VKVHILAIQADMSEADILQALRSFTGQQPRQAPEPQPKALPAPPSQPPGESPRRANQRKAPAKTGACDLVRQALQDGPKTAGQIRDWLRAHNHPNLLKNVARVLWSLIKQHEIQRDQNTGLCRLLP